MFQKTLTLTKAVTNEIPALSNKGLRITLSVFILSLSILGCSQQFELNDIFIQLEQDAKKERIIQFKELTLDSAIISYPEYQDIFTDAASKGLADSLNYKVYKSFVRNHKLDNSGVSTGRVIGGIFHCWQNKKEIDVVKLRHRVEELGYGYPQE